MKKKKWSFLTTMFCIDCEHMWEASNVSRPCPKCASKQVMPASRWAPWMSGASAPVRLAVVPEADVRIIAGAESVLEKINRRSAKLSGYVLQRWLRKAAGDASAVLKMAHNRFGDCWRCCVSLIHNA